VLVAMIAIPLALAGFFGLFAFRHWPRQLYRCTRCGKEFRRRAHQRFPRACPACGAADWAVR
jgi:hypothetical protein